MPGEFTSRFDKEILKSALAEQNKKALEQAKEKAEQDRIDNDVKEIGKLLEKRAGFIKERFANGAEEKVDYNGFRFAFQKSGDKKEAVFFMRVRLNDSRMAILVESQWEFPGAAKKIEYDYITLPTQKVDMDKARRFVETKLLDFFRLYGGQ
jgi:hypothetical protein